MAGSYTGPRKKYAQSEKGRAAARRYAESEKGKAKRRAYKKSHREGQSAAWKRWANSPLGRETRRRWSKSPGRVAYRRRWEAERRATIDSIKLAAGCIDCGFNAHPAALEFDHRDPSLKSFDISAHIGKSWAAVQNEIAKCDVRCSNCHRIRSFVEGHHLLRTVVQVDEPSAQQVLPW